jgi:mxaJ protein
MCSRFLRLVAGFVLVGSGALVLGETRELRVCADPNNLPFSNTRQQGFENRIAELLAKDLDARLKYVWQRMGRGFVREYLDKSQCDLLIGIPTGYRAVLTTAPYYRSTYVFLSRRDGGPQINSFNSPQLHEVRKIGVQVLDEEYTPPGEALARRGLQAAIVGFDTLGDDADSIVRAVAQQQVEVAVVWGPLAGYFARRYGDKLSLTPVDPEVDPPGLPFTFAISMGVRKGNVELRDELQGFLIRHQGEVQEILTEYGVPQLPLVAPAKTESAAK